MLWGQWWLGSFWNLERLSWGGEQKMGCLVKWKEDYGFREEIPGLAWGPGKNSNGADTAGWGKVLWDWPGRWTEASSWRKNHVLMIFPALDQERLHSTLRHFSCVSMEAAVLICLSFIPPVRDLRLSPLHSTPLECIFVFLLKEVYVSTYIWFQLLLSICLSFCLSAINRQVNI